MKRKIIGILVCTLLIAAGTIAVADWDPEDGHKMHWPQLPDPNGWDVYCTAGLTQWPYVCLADDWECSETGWIKDVHLWGSWWHDNVGEIDHFVIGIAENIPEDPPQNPYSKPGETLVEWEIYDWDERPYTGNQGWYWGYSPQWDPNDHQQYWQYNFFLDEEDWFWQEEGVIYWLFVSAIVKEEPADQPLWGWKSTYEDLHFMDDAVWGFWYELYWIPLTYPSGLTMDLAFVITGGEEECDPSIDVEKYVWDPDNNDWVDADTAADALDLIICTDARFKIVITNNGNCPLHDIIVNDKMHDSLKYKSANPDPDNYAYDPPYHYMDWSLDHLDPAEPFSIEIIAHVEGPDCSTDFNYVQVEGKCAHGTLVTDDDYAYVHAKEKARTVNRPFLNFLENYPILFPLLRLLLQQIGLY